MLSAVIIAKNEEKNIRRCIESLRFCTEILVMDNNSTDKTPDLAQSLGVRVEQFSLKDDYSAIRNRALELAQNKWVLYVDADEVVTPGLAAEILTAVSKSEYKGYLLKRLDNLWGRELHHGDVGSVYLLRLGRKTAGTWTGKVHETWQLDGRIGRLAEPLIHYPHQTLDAFLKSINRYSSIRAGELFDSGLRSGLFSVIFYPLGKFIRLWLIKRGFLDGLAGLIHALIMAFYSFLVRGKLYLLQKNIPDSNFT